MPEATARDQNEIWWDACRDAIYAGDVEALKALVAAGLKMHGVVEKMPSAIVTALHYPPVTQYLIEQGVSFAGRYGMQDSTLLHLAALNGLSGSIQLLINAGIPVDARDDANLTALHYAASAGHVEAVKLLVGAGAGIEDCDDNSQTPLFYAAQEGNVAIVEYLLESGANPHQIASRNESILHAATKLQADSSHIALHLLQAGANPDIRNDYGQTPEVVARIRKNHGFLAALEYWRLSQGVDEKDGFPLGPARRRI